MSNYKKEIVEKVLTELDYQKHNFGKKAVDLASELGINRATLSKLRKFEQYEKQINAEKMQEVFGKLLEMRQQINQQKQENESLQQFNGYNIQSLVGNYWNCTYYGKRLVWRNISILHLEDENVFTVDFGEDKGIYKGNYRLLNGFLYLDLTNEELQDKIMLIIHLGSIAFFIQSKEVLTGIVIRTSPDGQDIVSQRMILVREKEKNLFEFRTNKENANEEDGHEADLTQSEPSIKLWEEKEVEKIVALAMGDYKDNFIQSKPVESFSFENIKQLNPNWFGDSLLRDKFVGKYESWYCSPSQDKNYRFSIKKAILNIREDGTATLTTPYQRYRGKASLHLDTDVLEITALGGELENEHRRNGSLTMTFALGGIWKNDDFKVKQLHGVSSSIYMDGGPIIIREVLRKIGENDSSAKDEIPVGSPKYWEIILDNKNKDKELVLFLSGQTDNYIKTFRNPDKEFERWEDYGLLYFTSALYWAGKQEYDECVKNLGLALLHGFQEMELLENEFNNGALSHKEISSKFEPKQLNGKTYYLMLNFQEIMEKTTWKFFRIDLKDRWLKSFPK